MTAKTSQGQHVPPASPDLLASARRAGTETAGDAVTRWADAGMTADQVRTATERVLADRHHAAQTPGRDAYWDALDSTAATLEQDLRDADKPTPAVERPAGAAHPDPFLAGCGWHVGGAKARGLYVKNAEREAGS